jgi:hypothetical protein
MPIRLPETGIVVGSTKDLNPASFIVLRRINRRFCFLLSPAGDELQSKVTYGSVNAYPTEQNIRDLR